MFIECNYFLVSICLLAFLFLKDTFLFVGLLFCVLFYSLKERDKSVVILVFVMILLCIPRCNTSKPNEVIGSVVSVKEKYFIVQNGFEKTIVYYDNPVYFDSVVKVQGDLELIENREGFFSYKFGDWANSQGIYYSISAKNVEILDTHWSLRSWVQKKIEKSSDTYRTIVLKLIFNQNSSDSDFGYILQNSGFTIVGALLCIKSFLKYFLKEREVEMVEISILVVLAVFYHLNFITFRLLLNLALRHSKLSTYNKIGIYGIVCILFFPNQYNQIAFLFPFGYKILHALKTSKSTQFAFSLFLQSIFSLSINPVVTILYPIYIRILGIFYCIGWILVFFPSSMLFQFLSWLDRQLDVLSLFRIQGSIWGIGIIFFFLLASLYKKKKICICITFVLFYFFGLFHPLGEVTFINVGQGDSILIRLPFNQGNYLIDTGKPSQYSYLKTYLDALGIKKIHCLFITHSDEDHAGNIESLKADYEVSKLVDSHFNTIEYASLLFTDLNTVSNEEEENANSLVLYFTYNHLRFLCVGDAPSEIESSILMKYPTMEADILKLGHHGSDTSSSLRFLQTIQPLTAIVSSGKNNMYNHPSPIVVQRLLQNHIPYFDTKEEGDIRIIFTKYYNFLLTSTGKIAIIRAW